MKIPTGFNQIEHETDDKGPSTSKENEIVQNAASRMSELGGANSRSKTNGINKQSISNSNTRKQTNSVSLYDFFLIFMNASNGFISLFFH